MPSAEIPTLVDMCLTFMALNVCWMSNRFYSTSPESENYKMSQDKALLDREHAELNIVRRKYSDSLLEKLRYLYLSEHRRDAYGFREITEFLFQGCRNQSFHSREGYNAFSKFLLNQWSNHLSLRNAGLIRQEVFDALRSCQYLKRISLEACYFADLQILRLSCWRNLLSLNLLFSHCSDSIIMHVFQECPNLGTLKATGKFITNNCLFHLCIHHGYSEAFEFCQKQGSCCKLGKNLTTLVLYGTGITEEGVACALQHLPLLEKFLEGGLENRDRHFLVRGIRELCLACELNNLPDPILKLDILMCNSYLNIPDREKDCCPSLDKVVSKHPAATGGHAVNLMKDRNNTYSISISVKYPFFSWLFVENIIEYMHMYKPVYFCIEDGATVDIQFPDSNSVALDHGDYHNLEEIHFLFSQGIRLPTEFFRDMLGNAVNLKYLTIGGGMEEAFISAMAINPFSHLEEITFYQADLRYISLESIIRRGLKLKTVSYYCCDCETCFASEHRKMARENNFHLEIHESELIAMCDPPIRFNLI